VAGSQIWSGCPALAGGRDAAGVPGARSPGTVTMARSAASSIRSRRSISSPRYSTSDASSAVLRGRIRAQNAARLRMSVRRLLIAARVATWGIPRHLSASRRPSGQAGPAACPASFSGGRRVVVIIGIGLSFAVCGCCGHCVRCRTHRAGARLTPGGTVGEQLITERLQVSGHGNGADGDVVAGMTPAGQYISQVGQRRDLILHCGLCRREIRGLVQQWLAAQVAGDGAGLADGGRGGLGIAQAREIAGAIEQAMGEVVRRAQLRARARPSEARPERRAANLPSMQVKRLLRDGSLRFGLA